VGWIIGVTVVKFVSSYFEVSGFTNLYGWWSDKMAVEAVTLSRLELILSLTFGYFTMKYINKFIHPYVEKVFNKIEEKMKLNVMQGKNKLNVVAKKHIE